jgi:hypothetical protein
MALHCLPGFHQPCGGFEGMGQVLLDFLYNPPTAFPKLRFNSTISHFILLFRQTGSSRLPKMGLFSRFAGWIHLQYVKLREYLNVPKYSCGEYQDYKIIIIFMNGATMDWKGTPWGTLWEDFKSIMRENGRIDEVWTNMRGDFWEGGAPPWSGDARLMITF